MAQNERIGIQVSAEDLLFLYGYYAGFEAAIPEHPFAADPSVYFVDEQVRGIVCYKQEVTQPQLDRILTALAAVKLPSDSRFQNLSNAQKRRVLFQTIRQLKEKTF